MAVIRTEKVVALLTAGGPTGARLATDIIRAGHLPARALEKYDRASAIALYDQLKEYTARRGHFTAKYLRPWDVDPDVLGKLDRNQPWWGWEFELGFKTQQERADTINHVWDTWDGVTFDHEGEGDYASEITFVPSESGNFYDRSAPALQFMKHISDNKIGLVTNNSNIGTHLNISLPEMDGNNVPWIAAAMNASLALLPRITEDGTDPRKEMFGRSVVFGGFYARGQYIEAKLFRTTYNIDRFVTYIRSAEVITRAMTAIKEYGAPVNGTILLVSNLWKMFTGEEIEPELKLIRAKAGQTIYPAPNSGFTIYGALPTVEYRNRIIAGLDHYSPRHVPADRTAEVHEDVFQYVDELPIRQPLRQAA